MWDCSSQKIVYSTVRVNGCLFVVEQIDGICEVGSRERGFCKRRFFFGWIRRLCCGGFGRGVKNGRFGFRIG